MGHHAARDGLTQREAKEDFRGDAFHGQRRQVLEAKTLVVSGMPDQRTALSAQRAELAQTLAYQRSADSVALVRRRDGDWSEDIPAAFRAVDEGGREGDVSDDDSIDFRHQSDGQRARRTQGFDDQRLGLPAVGLGGEGRQKERADAGVVRRSFGSNNHDG